MIPPFFSPRWRWPTVAVIIGMLFLARLGVWQLDRLEWRRALNARTAFELEQPPVSLNTDLEGLNLTQMENRQAIAAGKFDYDRQFIIESQPLNGRPGVFLLTPLRLAGRPQAVLVNRGWVPDGSDPAAYVGPANDVITGIIQPSQTLSGGRVTEVTADRTLFRIDVAAMGERLPYDVLPIYIVPQAVDPRADNFPIVIQPDLTLDEGNHLSYAIQWFSFAVLLGVIYGVYVKRQETSDSRPQTSDEPTT